ncbi:MAG: nitroreductase family protein [Hyphomicrobiales bacterium]|nr:nitroreductase family protein [Hyphomicrobiales bacterium]MBV8823760.1 nitroreductase family protein [Hyphomicrobiales bacterium]
MSNVEAIRKDFAERFGEDIRVDADLSGLDEIARIAGRRVHRRYDGRAVDPALLRLLCACALSAPSKSDLQQRDIVVVENRTTRQTIADLIPDMPWIAQAPVFLVFCANGRRLSQIAALRGKPFPNDHLDLLFNAATDAALALGSFMDAARAVGLGCCPISVIRDHAARISELLALPEKVIPYAGLCVGWPATPGRISPRLPLALTVHLDRFREDDLPAQLAAYDARRAAIQPYAAQRDPQVWGEAAHYGWSEDKARQYAQPQRTGFGAYVRARGFNPE